MKNVNEILIGTYFPFFFSWCRHVNGTFICIIIIHNVHINTYYERKNIRYIHIHIYKIYILQWTWVHENSQTRVNKSNGERERVRDMAIIFVAGNCGMFELNCILFAPNHHQRRSGKVEKAKRDMHRCWLLLSLILYIWSACGCGALWCYWVLACTVPHVPVVRVFCFVFVLLMRHGGSMGRREMEHRRYNLNVKDPNIEGSRSAGWLMAWQ